MNNWTSIITPAAHGLTPKGVEYCHRVVTSPPSRNPSNSTGKNLIVDFASQKMGHTVQVESLTAEAALAQQLEVDSSCIGYWSQPLTIPIQCTCRNGIKKAIWLTFDFLVAYPDHIELVECKTEEEAFKLSLEFPGRYHRGETGNWTGPEVDVALKEYGIRFRIVTTAELPSILIRNFALLSEARQTQYSTSVALDAMLRCVPEGDQGIPLAELIERTGFGFTKNDVYFAILKSDLHVLLDVCLLVDGRTTRVFAHARHADVHRLLNFQTKPRTAAPLILKQGSRICWNGTEYTICNASPQSVYLLTKGGEPTRLPQGVLNSLLSSGEIQLLEEGTVPFDVLKYGLQRHLKVFTQENQQKAINRKRFLDFKKEHPNARPEDFCLGSASKRTIQRWAAQAKESEAKYGNPFWLLLDQPRDGRPRDDLPSELREAMTEIANELYFTKDGRSLAYVWRALKKKRQDKGLYFPSKGALRRHIAQMKNLQATTIAREGGRAGYKFGNSDLGEPNWITPGDFPFKVAQMDGVTLDVEVVDDETGEALGKPTLTLMTLPELGSAPIGWCLLLEEESYRSATLAVRDQIERYGEPVKFLIIDNGKAFNNVSFDQLLAILDITKVDRRPYDPRFASEIESLFATLNREVIHNLAGNTKATQDVQNMSSEMDPTKRAVWSFQALHRRLEEYLFTMLWDAPSASLGTTPRKALEQKRKLAPSREGRFVLSPDQAKVAFLPEVADRTRVVQPGRGIYVEGYYYWNELMKQPGVEKSTIAVRYDPFDLYTVYAAINGKWVECSARHAPELRNVTEKTRRVLVAVRRRLKNNHAERREDSHGQKLAQFSEELRNDETVLRQNRRARAQQCATRNDATDSSTESPKDTFTTPPGVSLPAVDFTDLRESA